MKTLLEYVKHFAFVHKKDTCTVITRSAVQEDFSPLCLLVLDEGSLFLST